MIRQRFHCPNEYVLKKLKNAESIQFYIIGRFHLRSGASREWSIIRASALIRPCAGLGWLIKDGTRSTLHLNGTTVFADTELGAVPWEGYKGSLVTHVGGANPFVHASWALDGRTRGRSLARKGRDGVTLSCASCCGRGSCGAESKN